MKQTTIVIIAVIISVVATLGILEGITYYNQIQFDGALKEYEEEFQNPSKLNIILILTDDQRWDTICIPQEKSEICKQLSEPPMPFIQKEIFDKGYVFTNAHVTNPSCCPSRASILSGGFYSHNTGVLKNSHPHGGIAPFTGLYGYPNIDETTIVTVLQENGYKTGLIGKYLKGYTIYSVNNSENSAYIPPGWDNFEVVTNYSDNWDSPTFLIGHNGIDEGQEKYNKYIAEIEKEKSISFIKNNCGFGKCDSPFFLFLSTKAPHWPFRTDPNHPEDLNFVKNFSYRDRGWGEGVFSNCDNIEDIKLRDKPRYIENKLKNNIHAIYNVNFCEFVTSGEFDKNFRNYLASLRTVDRTFFEIYEELDSRDLLDKTVIIFSSDNGYMWGEHASTEKAQPYEESIRVPLAIRLPSKDHKIINDLVALNLDIPSTILEIAGIKHEIIEKSDGKSLTSFFSRDSVELRNELLFQHFNHKSTPIPSWAAIKTYEKDETGNYELWKYVEYVTGEKELYNLGKDPFELDNYNNKKPELVDKFSERLSKIRGIVILTSNFPDPYSDKLPEAIKGKFYSFQLHAVGGNGDYSWKFYNDGVLPLGRGYDCDGDAPAWVDKEKFKKSGIISGNPSWNSDKNVKWEFCVYVEDSSVSPHPQKNTPQSFVKPVIITASKD